MVSLAGMSCRCHLLVERCGLLLRIEWTGGSRSIGCDDYSQVWQAVRWWVIDGIDRAALHSLMLPGLKDLA